MKKILASVMGMIGIFALVAFFAFSSPNRGAEKAARRLQWFEWQPQNGSTDTSDPNNYQSGDPGCSGGTSLCSVRAASKEDIDDPALQTEIANALSDPENYTGENVQLKE